MERHLLERIRSF